jgi:hypothetical protein
MVCDLRSVLALHDVLDGQRAANLLDQLAQELQQVVLRPSNDFELVDGGLVVADLEGIQGDAGPKKVCAEAKLVDLSRSVSDTDRLEPGVLESFETRKFCNQCVEALATELSIPGLRTVVDDLVARCDLTAASTDYRLGCLRRSLIHCR